MAVMGINDPRQQMLTGNTATGSSRGYADETGFSQYMTPDRTAAWNEYSLSQMSPQAREAMKGLMAQYVLNKAPMQAQQGNAPVMATGSPMIGQRAPAVLGYADETGFGQPWVQTPEMWARANARLPVGMANPQQPQVTGGSQYLFPTAPQAANAASIGAAPSFNIGQGSAGDLSAGQILAGLGAVGVGGLLGGTSGAAGVLGDLGTLYSGYTQGQAQEDINRNLAKAYGNLSPVLQEQVQFKPFTVTSSTGAVQTTPQGGYSVGLTPEQQAIQNQLFGTASGLFSQVGQPTAQRESDVYNQIRALQTPQEEQARLALEERMAAQGRLGLSSAAYGGATPELMAQEQAISQARQQAALAAISQAQAEQAQAAEIGRGLFTSGYLPQANVLNMMQPAVNLASLANTGQREGANLMAQLAIAQMQAQANAAAAQAQNRGDIATMLTGLLTGGGTKGGSSILDKLLGGIGSLFSGGSSGGSGAIDNLDYYFNDLGSNLGSIVIPTGAPSDGTIDNLGNFFTDFGNTGNITIPTGEPSDGTVDNLGGFFGDLGGKG